MKKTILLVSTIVIALVGFLVFFNTSHAQPAELNLGSNNSAIDLFYSDTCPHCKDEIVFLNKLQIKYTKLIVNKHSIADPKSAPLLKALVEKHDAEKYLGLVPITFIGDRYFVGFDNGEGIGQDIEDVLLENGILNSDNNEITDYCDEEKTEVCAVTTKDDVSDISQNYTAINQVSNLNIFGLDAHNLSLPILAISLGFFDGFNVCSLGALMLILSLVLVFKSKKKVLFFGGLFLVVTGITYALLIFVWFAIFQLLSPFVFLLEAIVGLLGLIGGLFFLKQYIQFKKHGAMCEQDDSSWIQKVTNKLKLSFHGQKNIWIISLSVILFSLIVTIIEFPCSAVIPVTFAAILTSAKVGVLAKMVYLLIFMFFYLLDEIIVFLVGVWTLRLWVGGTKITSTLPLIQAIVFISLGLFYILRLIF